LKTSEVSKDNLRAVNGRIIFALGGEHQLHCANTHSDS
jgi:hypothetical protein